MSTGRRHRAREAALQMLYQWEIGGVLPQQAAALFWSMDQDEAPGLTPAARRFAEQLAQGTADAVPAIDPLIERHTEHWRVGRLAVIDRLILRMAVYELLHGSGTPARVVIDEALELARTFSEDEAVRFVNGVLDAIYHSIDQTRPVE